MSAVRQQLLPRVDTALCRQMYALMFTFLFLYLPVSVVLFILNVHVHAGGEFLFIHHPCPCRCCFFLFAEDDIVYEKIQDKCFRYRTFPLHKF